MSNQNMYIVIVPLIGSKSESEIHNFGANLNQRLMPVVNLDDIHLLWRNTWRVNLLYQI